MKYTEEITLFTCAGDTLLGILVKPEAPVGTVGVVVVVGGPQYRVGSHRQFVLLSRALASAGFPVLRFDYRGMGDSEGQQRTFESVSSDIGVAIDALLQRMPTVTEVALWGMCDGASAALLYCGDTNDLRISGLCLVNPWVRSEVSLARTHLRHYYVQRIMQKEFWLKALRGRVALQALRGLFHKILVSTRSSTPQVGSAQKYQQKMAAAWLGFSGQISLLLSGEDYTAKEFIEFASANDDWESALTRPSVIRHDFEGADHTFSTETSHAKVVRSSVDWLKRMATIRNPNFLYLK